MDRQWEVELAQVEQALARHRDERAQLLQVTDDYERNRLHGVARRYVSHGVAIE